MEKEQQLSDEVKKIKDTYGEKPIIEIEAPSGKFWSYSEINFDKIIWLWLIITSRRL